VTYAEALAVKVGSGVKDAAARSSALFPVSRCDTGDPSHARIGAFVLIAACALASAAAAQSPSPAEPGGGRRLAERPKVPRSFRRRRAWRRAYRRA
jgi:hypothetical protein